MRSINGFVVLLMLAGCAHPKAVLQSDGPTMRELIEGGRRIDARTPERRVDALPAESWRRGGLEHYTRDALNEVDQLFPRLENPEIAIYVYPHLATDRRLPVPGYTTAMPLYDRYEYALPGEAGR